MIQSRNEKIWCLVPAAGIGSRMQSDRPKQYLNLMSSTVLDTTLLRLLSSKKIDNIVVCLKKNDPYWPKSSFSGDDRIQRAEGGEERANSVLNGLKSMKQKAAQDDWVLVHDAARPCVRHRDIDSLITAALNRQQGAILALPIHDTVKKVDNDLVDETVDRTSFWRALTPQIFKFGELEKALISAEMKGQTITDEASAIEQMGQSVHVVQGHADNIKITSPEDLELARFYLQQQSKEQCA